MTEATTSTPKPPASLLRKVAKIIKAADTGDVNGALYLDTALVAKLIRVRLAYGFPGCKFRVRISRYSMGSSIDVRWTDGPLDKAVEAEVGAYAGAGFDGMIDLKYHQSAWLMPDGTVSIAHTDGTTGSRGYVPEVIASAPGGAARLVKCSSDYVFTHREVGVGLVAQAIAASYDKWAELEGVERPVIGAPSEFSGAWLQECPQIMVHNQWLDSLLMGEAHKLPGPGFEHTAEQE